MMINTIRFASLILFSLIGFGHDAIAAQSPTATADKKVAAEPVAEKVFVGIQRVFEPLRFDRPIFLTGAGDDSGRVFIVEQAGLIHWFSKSQPKPTAKVFLDIRERVSRRGNEEGLLGIAFHPNFAENGFVYCHYSSDLHRTGRNKVAENLLVRYTVSADKQTLDPSSEKILLKVAQPYQNHNGGAIMFGPDGFLYISLGDGGLYDDPQGNGQNLSTLLGSLLRIDVNSTDGEQPYSIPTDNPFVDVDDARPEIFAWGLRNVWRFSFDRKTGDLWGADVGQNRFEEVNIIKKGGNYGWNRYEADREYKTKTDFEGKVHDEPVAVYGRQWGQSITGGYVYRGKEFPQLDGSYFFGDYVSGNLWRTQKDDAGKYQTELVRRTGRSIASFGEDDDGELYLVSFDGGIYRIVPTEKPEETFKSWPQKISETGLYASVAEKRLADHLIPYQVNAPFWSDGAQKERYFVLPEGSSLGYRENGSWEVPVGATIVKNFSVQVRNRTQMLETRLIKRTTAGWESATYVWDPRGRDAKLLPDGKQFEFGLPIRYSWHAPSASECASCHVDAAGYVLGLNTAQLNRDADDGSENQILSWIKQGYVDAPADLDLAKAAKYCSPSDASADLNERARVWLDVNCAMCHRPNGPGNANIDLRFARSLEETKTVDVLPAQGHFGIKDGKIISPGQPEQSLLLHRVKTLNAGRMPSIGSNRVDKKAVNLLTKWIESLKKP